jgi:hypothetical protein
VLIATESILGVQNKEVNYCSGKDIYNCLFTLTLPDMPSMPCVFDKVLDVTEGWNVHKAGITTGSQAGKTLGRLHQEAYWKRHRSAPLNFCDQADPGETSMSVDFDFWTAFCRILDSNEPESLIIVNSTGSRNCPTILHTVAQNLHSVNRNVGQDACTPHQANLKLRL